MKFTTTLLATLATASLTAAAPSSSLTSGETLTKRDPLCGASTYTGDTAADSPLVADCDQLLRYMTDSAVRDGRTDWEIVAGEKRNLASYKSCMISARGLGTSSAVLGTDELVGIVTEGIEEKAVDGKIGVRGVDHGNKGW
ncbi:hypothetical protein QBC47DRAFT_462397 [Echria macrotheca]|uniref:Ecp2 effector protein-like domain-containing protein n=1 Tax=Echria macrotheca TaxID=438768 RepID=A0AAJ0B8F7_9PEZI|nr:hypothetical protein QBC47DRAFT_462397 [Echria macrotheca]